VRGAPAAGSLNRLRGGGLGGVRRIDAIIGTHIA